jgi:hypothetical protein
MGIEVAVSGAGGHVSRIERRIRTINESVRAHIACKLPYSLTALGILRVSLQLPDVRAARRWWKPPRIIYGKSGERRAELQGGVRRVLSMYRPEYRQQYVGTHRGLLPTGNRSGFVKMMSIETADILTRNQFRVVPMTPYIISQLNKLAEKEGRSKSSAESRGQEVESGGVDTLTSFAPAPSGESDDPIQGMNPTPPDYAETMLPEPTSAELGDTGEGNRYPDTEEREMLEVREEPGGEEPVEVEQVATPVRRSMMDMFRRGGVEMALSTSVLESIEKKIGGDLSDYVMNITVKQAMKTRGEEAEKVIMKELSQMVDKRVWRPVHVYGLSAQDRERLIRL